jgi:hypothetical protein
MHEGTMVKQRWHDGENTKARCYDGESRCNITFSLSYHRDFTIVPSFHRGFTIVPSLFHHRAIVVSPSCYRCFTIVPSPSGSHARTFLIDCRANPHIVFLYILITARLIFKRKVTLESSCKMLSIEILILRANSHPYKLRVKVLLVFIT